MLRPGLLRPGLCVDAGGMVIIGYGSELGVRRLRVWVLDGGARQVRVAVRVGVGRSVISLRQPWSTSSEDWLVQDGVRLLRSTENMRQLRARERS